MEVYASGQDAFKDFGNEVEVGDGTVIG